MVVLKAVLAMTRILWQSGFRLIGFGSRSGTALEMAFFERTTNVRIASVTLVPERVQIEKHIGTSLAIKSAFDEGSKSSRKSDLNAIRIGDSQLTSSLLKAVSHGYAREYSRRTANRGMGRNQIKTEADNPPGLTDRVSCMVQLRSVIRRAPAGRSCIRSSRASL